MSRAVLVVNAGSSSIKFALYEEAARCVFRGNVDGLGDQPAFEVKDPAGRTLTRSRLEANADHHAALAAALGWIEGHDAGWQIVAAGHRVVHGGDRYAAPIRIDDEVLRELERLCPLAPLHQPHNVAGIRAILAHRPQLFQVACFDTAFHQAQPEIARMFALPWRLHEAGVKRYGFHGLSYEYIAARLPDHLGVLAEGRVIVAHLGNGSSLCAIRGRRSVASTMGFTALDGLMMGTRTGSIDPGVLLYLMDEKKMGSRDLERLLYRESGLLGVSGVSHDMRTLLASSEPRAKLAVDLYVYRIAREIGSLAAVLGGLDALVFTAGIGERAAPVRAAVCEASRWLGVEIDAAANAADARLIGSDSSRVPVAVIPTNEEEMIARHTLDALSACASSDAGSGQCRAHGVVPV